MAARDAFIRKLIFDPKYGAIAQFVREIPTNPAIRAVRVNRYVVPKKVLSIFLRSRLPTYTRYRNDNELLQRIDQNRASDKNILWFTFSPNQILSDKTIEGFAKALNLPPDQLTQAPPNAQPTATEQLAAVDQTTGVPKSHPASPHQNPASKTKSGPLTPRSPVRSRELTPPTRAPQPEEPFFAPHAPQPITPPPQISSQPIPEEPHQPTPEPPFFAQETPEEPSEPPPSFSPPRIQIPSFALDMASNAKILMRRVLTKQIVQQSVIAGMGGGAAGILTFGLPGGVIGGLAGAALPTFRSLGGFKALGGIGGKALLGGATKAGLVAAGVATGPPGWVAAAATLAPSVVKPIVKRATQTTLIIILCIIGFILLAILIPTGGLNFVQNNALFPPYSQQTSTGPGASQQNRLEIVKSGPAQVANGGTIEYTISVIYRGSGKANLTVTDTLPKTVAYVGSSDQGQRDESGKVSWTLTDLSSGTKKDLTLTVQALPEADDSYVVNQAQATITKTTGVALGGASRSDILQCKFYRNDSTPQAVEYQSPLLISYIKEASQITGIPAAVLAGLVRVESTVGSDGATGNAYTISEYTDDDVRAMEKAVQIGADGTSPISKDIDATIPNNNKALCPRSTAGALGITQIQPSEDVHEFTRQQIQSLNQTKSRNYKVTPNFNSVGAYARNSVNRGAQLLSPQKTAEQLTVEDYCNPKTSLILAGGFILEKMGLNSWQAPQDPAEYEKFINKVARVYYGDDGKTGLYGNSLWRSVSECKQNTNVPENEFSLLMRSQGRNVNILGDESSFISTVVSNGSSFNLGNKVDYLRKIYASSVAKNLNPLAMLSLWGEESLFSTTSQIAFGCDPYGMLPNPPRGFDAQLSCILNTFNNFMTNFEEKGHNSIDVVTDRAGTVKTGEKCVYDDPFLYAYEWFGPVCHYNDGNDTVHNNFVQKYKTLSGTL